MRELTKKPAPEKGTIYSGRCAGGNFNGAQLLFIAPDNEALAAAWEALQGVTLNTDLVYDVSVIATKKLDALLTPKPAAELHPLDVA